jgi:hypothetical protein
MLLLNLHLPPQIVRRPVALAALRELFQNPLRMRLGMTGITRRHGHVLVLVAEHTGQIAVLGGVLGQHVLSIAVTGAAPVIGRILAILDYQRHMHRMTGCTGLKIHIFGMFSVALGAIGNVLMGLMTFVARKIPVGARMGFDLIALLLVTAQASPKKLAFQSQGQRRVGVRMAASAIFQLIVGLTAVAHIAPGNGIVPQWRMFHVAVHTPDIRPVFFSMGRNGLVLLGMAMHALRIEQGRRSGRLSRGLHVGGLFRGRRGLHPCRLLTGKNPDQHHDSNHADNAARCFENTQFSE